MTLDDFHKLIDSILSADGIISQKLESFEPRQQQLDFAHSVAKSFYEKTHAVIEAGTGVGKSFGYLVPAILYSVEESKNSEKLKTIVISTHTKNLQEQLANIDIPFLASEIFDFDFNTVVVKGRNNYLCKRRLYKALSTSNSLFKDKTHDVLSEIAEWAEITESGDFEEFDSFLSQTVKDTIQSDKDACLGKRCAHSKDCFYQNVRKKMHKANILIVNHALLFSDLKQRISKNGFLPDYQNLIFDEAHTLEKIATEHFGGEVRETYLEYLLGKLLNRTGTKGLVFDWNIQADIKDPVNEVRKETGVYFDNWRAFVHEMSKNPHKEERSQTLKDEVPFENKLTPKLRILADILGSLSETVEDEETQLEIRSFSSKLAEFASFLDFIKEPVENTIRWVSLDSAERRKDKVNLAAAPILVNQSLQDYMFSQLESMIMTSATISTGTLREPFYFFKDRVGLQLYPSSQNEDEEIPEPRKVLEMQLGSPFDFSKNVVFITPVDIPEPSARGFQDELPEHIYKAITLTKGGAFVLFTSYYLMNRVYNQLKDKLETDGYPIFLQSSSITRSKLLAEFKKSKNGILFGTDSFWQGVDVQGDTLRLVIITKLPFDVPSDPLFKARSDQLESEGRNSFSEYSVPLAVLKFVQGFGRLIRHRNDKGVIVVLDRRLISKSYGINFINALPKCIREKRYPDKLPFDFTE